MSKLNQVSVLILCVFLLTGCWDKVEVEERAFVYGIAVDLAENSSNKKTTIELTQQLIVPSALSAMQGGGGGGPAFRNLSHSGQTIIDTNREMIKQASRKTDVTHLDVILFSEDVAKQPQQFKQLMDVFLRERDMRRGIKVVITSGKAGELLSVVPEHEKIPAEYISKILEPRGNLEILDLVKIGDIQEKLLEKESFPLSQLSMMEPTIINYEGIAVYNGHKEQLVGTLKGDEAKGVSLIRGQKNTGTINIEVEGETATIELLKIKSDISLENEEVSNLKFSLKITVDGTIAEQFGAEDVAKKEVVEKFEDALEKEISETAKKTFDKLQGDLQTDILGFGRHLHHFHPKLWGKVKNDWDHGKNYFSASSIDITVNVKVDKPGNINRTSTDRGAE